MAGVSDKIVDLCGTLILFLVTFSLSPILGSCYSVLQIYRKVWLKGVSFLNPDVDFIKSSTIRSLVDTPRNKGIFTLLLTINGTAQPDLVRRHLQEVVNQQDKFGKSVFPRLKQCLVTRWGQYAWINESFDLDQNLILASSTYRGRPVAEINIQDYISDIVSKHLPVGVSPWQIIVIPGTDEHHYLLLRIHHALVNEGLNIADLLPLASQPRRINDSPNNEIRSPLVDVVKKPKNLPFLRERIQEDFTNLWNEFISNYDPLEQTQLLKTPPGLFQFLAIAFITIASTIKEVRKGYGMVVNDNFSKLKFIISTASRECDKRGVSFSSFINSYFVTLNPINITKRIILHFWGGYIFMLKVPYWIYQELMALYSCLTLQYCKYPNTIIGWSYNYCPLLYNSAKEVLFYLNLIVRAPRTILEQILLEPETVQTIPPCGRKVIAWSKPVKREVIQKIAKCTAASETEILLATISVTIARYCNEAGIIIPTKIPVTIRNVNSNYIFLNGSQVKPQDSVSGLIGLRLPILTSETDEAILENLSIVKTNFEKAIESQSISYLLTTLQTKYGTLTNCLPASVIEILLKYLSRKYTISVTEITSKNPLITQHTTWGEEVLGAIYWRPPQANMSISLCFNQYGENITLGVMCDAQLLPYHPILARQFSYHIEDLAMAAGIN